MSTDTTDSTHIIVRRRTGELTEVGKTKVSVYGWHISLVDEHLREHLTRLSGKWCSVECMARAMFRRASEENKARVRKRIPNAFRVLLMRYGQFMVIEYDETAEGHGKIKAFKLFESSTDQESQYARGQIERMAKRKQMTAEMEQRAITIVQPE